MLIVEKTYLLLINMMYVLYLYLLFELCDYTFYH